MLRCCQRAAAGRLVLLRRPSASIAKRASSSSSWKSSSSSSSSGLPGGGRQWRRTATTRIGTATTATTATRSVSSRAAAGGSGGGSDSAPTAEAALLARKQSPSQEGDDDPTAAAAALALFGNIGTTTTTPTSSTAGGGLTMADVAARAREITSRSRCRTESRDAPTRSGGPLLPARTASAAAAAATAAAAAAVEAERRLDAAVSAADALLSLTSSPALVGALSVRGGRDAAARRGDASGEVDGSGGGSGGEVETLHVAFLSVSSWLQSSIVGIAGGGMNHSTAAATAGAGTDLALSRCVDLAERSTDLNLPLHLPLFASLIDSIAALHSVPSRIGIGGGGGGGIGGSASSPKTAAAAATTVARLIMEIAQLSQAALHPLHPPRAALLEGALVTLVRRGLVRDATDLLMSMGDDLGITEVDAAVSLEMLTLVADGLGLLDGSDDPLLGIDEFSNRPAVRLGSGSDDGSAAVRDVDPADAMELVLLLRGPLLRQLDVLSEQIEEDIGRLVVSSSSGAAPAPSSGVGSSDAANIDLVDLLERLAADAGRREERDDDGSGVVGREDDDDDDDDEGGEFAIALVDADWAEEEDRRRRKDESHLALLERLRGIAEAVGDSKWAAASDVDDGKLADGAGGEGEEEEEEVSSSELQAEPTVQSSSSAATATSFSSSVGEESQLSPTSPSSLHEALEGWTGPDQPLPDPVHDRLAREVLYVRNGPAWDLPDVVGQLSALRSGRDVLYARDYEEYLLEEMEREEELYGLDEDGGDGYDDEDDYGIQ